MCMTPVQIKCYIHLEKWGMREGRVVSMRTAFFSLLTARRGNRTPKGWSPAPHSYHQQHSPRTHIPSTDAFLSFTSQELHPQKLPSSGNQYHPSNKGQTASHCQVRASVKTPAPLGGLRARLPQNPIHPSHHPALTSTPSTCLYFGHDTHNFYKRASQQFSESTPMAPLGISSC